MRKAVKVNYPKKKPRLKLEDLGDVAEPERYSMYSVLQDNLKIANRATFLHRIIYVGEHSFLDFDDARCVFENIINQSNETYCIEKLSGFFLYYPKYYVHMVEGDEDNLNKHLGLLLDKDAAHAFSLGDTKLLIHVSHINQRFFEDWVYFTGVPPKLLEKLDYSGDMQQSGRYIYNCIKKIYSLIGNYADDLATIADGPGGETATFDVATINSIESDSIPNSTKVFPSFSFVSQTLSQDRSVTAKDYKLVLPEYELLEFILRSSCTMKLQEYYGLYGVVPMRDIYKDRVWPVPHDFIPYDIFEKPYDCIIELPKETRKTAYNFPSELTSSVSKAFIGEDFKDIKSSQTEVKETQETKETQVEKTKT